MNHYRQHELPDIFNKTKPGSDAADENRKSRATQVMYEGYLKGWILLRWGACCLADLRAVEVEKWLRTLIQFMVRSAFTGFRRGKRIGLRWEDVDFEQMVLQVRRSVVAMVEDAGRFSNGCGNS